MNYVIGLDPGPEKSALVVWSEGGVGLTRLCPNADILGYLHEWRAEGGLCGRSFPEDLRLGSIGVAPLVIEKIESYGMGVGAETFETVFWSGRFAEAYGMHNTQRLGRKAIKLHLCGSVRATDSNIRYAIIDRFGGKDKAIGKKSNPGILFGITSHLWAALAVSLTYHDQHATASVAPSAVLAQ